jgi:hypothetical protein
MPPPSSLDELEELPPLSSLDELDELPLLSLVLLVEVDVEVCASELWTAETSARVSATAPAATPVAANAARCRSRCVVMAITIRVGGSARPQPNIKLVLRPAGHWLGPVRAPAGPA